MKRARVERRLKWVREGLIVRVINDRYRNGTFYNKKAQIKTIMNEYKFLACPLNSTTVLDDLEERDLETVLPSSSEMATATVMVLRGEHAGEKGRLLSKDKKRERVQL